jgi:Transposase DDE domain
MLAGMKHATEALESWDVLLHFLPTGWEDQARISGALRRTRGVSNAAGLLRVLLIHLAQGCSLAETAVRAREAGLAQLSAVALFKRLRASEPWLLWLAQQVGGARQGIWSSPQRVVRAIDATVVSEPGSTGTDWRLHYGLRLADLRCDFFELTDVRGGESWKRVPVRPAEILLGDRMYGRPSGIAHVLRAKADVIVRITPSLLPLLDAQGDTCDPLQKARSLRVGQVGSWPTQVQHERQRFSGRLLAVRRSAAATRKEQKRLRREASRDGRKISQRSWKGAQYLFLWTSLPDSFSAELALEYYRRRWQIELAFKRMKSLAGLGHLPKKDPASARAWLYGKLFVSLLAEHLIQAAQRFSPWGYQIPLPTQSVA